MTRYVTRQERGAQEREAIDERFRLYRLCECGECGGTGKMEYEESREGMMMRERCPVCRGEGRTRELVATATDPESVGVALVTLGREGEWDECPIGILDTQGETGHKWIVSPWLPSARNVSDAGRTLAKARKHPSPSSQDDIRRYHERGSS